MDRSAAKGFALRVLGSTVAGSAVGAIAGLALTAFNNLVLDAAEGSYLFWATLLGKLLLIPSLVGGIVWGVVFLQKRARGSARG